MVAPTRTPQARGVKCDLCKKILTSATWLDQTKLATDIHEAQVVLDLVKEHNKIDCPCIPKNIENLLVGSTHFEIHRLAAKQLDNQVHKRQLECYLQRRHRVLEETPKYKKLVINDCYDSQKASRFKIYPECVDQKQLDVSKIQLKHLLLSIDFWQIAMEDQTNPFNSKLAHRLGLTHHVIYACYLFKYYKILDYQLVAANLLLNIFRSIEGVTDNAILHAYFLLIKSLIDCDQIQLARSYLKHATRLAQHSDNSHYESILIHCVSCELNFIEGREMIYSELDDLALLAKIKPDDKLQHYYSRTLAINILIKNIHNHPSRFEQCFEFFHAYRYICAIIRRCYESSFEVVMAEKEIITKQSKLPDSKHTQILDHSWIRYAACDLVFSTFEQVAEFHIRAGMPEYLDLLYNGLNLISYRNGSLCWQSKMASIGVRLDLLCDKYNDAKEKLDLITRLVDHSDNSHLMNVMRLESEVGLMTLLNQQGSVISKAVILDLVDTADACESGLVDRLSKIELFDVKSYALLRLTYNHRNTFRHLILTGCLADITLRILKVGVMSASRAGKPKEALELIDLLKDLFKSQLSNSMKYSVHHIILEMLLQFADIDKSGQRLLEAINGSQIFLKVGNPISDLQQQISNVTIATEREKIEKYRKRTTRKITTDKLLLNRTSRRKGTYEVARVAERNDIDQPSARLFDLMEALVNLQSLTKEEIVATYLRNSEPNPDYNLYRCAHELMLSFRILDLQPDSESILFHFSESTTSNTMRYRWMMMEEQQLTPFDQCKTHSMVAHKPEGTSCSRQLGFCNTLVNQDNITRTMTRAIPEGYRLVQMRYILDTDNDLEHLLCASCKSENEPVYIHAKRPLVSDDFFGDAKLGDDKKNELTIPNRFSSLIEDSKRSLLDNNHRTRLETRQRIETDLGVILHDIENEWLGPFRFIMCGDVCDQRYGLFADNLIEDLQATVMSEHPCHSRASLKLAIENAPLLSRDEFCEVIRTLFNCQTALEEPRECFNRWQKSLESFMKLNNLGSNKTMLLQRLDRAQLGLILDNSLGLIPFESLPIVRITNQGVFRVPSLRLFSIISSRRCSPIKIRPTKVAYMLDPANNLSKTRERFESKLTAQRGWSGSIGRPPEDEALESWLKTRDLYLFIGHGAGTAYYNKLCNGRGLGHLSHISSVAIVMGCSSGRMLCEGPRLEPFGIGWVFIFRGSPCYLGLLWDVTDNDIDKFLDTLIDTWMPSIGWSTRVGSFDKRDRSCEAITNVSIQARNSCQLKLLVGSTPVVYGMPIWCKN